MTKIFRVPLHPLSQNAFSLYGQAQMVLPEQKPDDSGQGWQCWYPVGILNSSVDWQIGIVQTDPRSLIVNEMERHLARAEWVFALDKPLIQAVTLSEAGDHISPDPGRFMAFLLQPGQSVMIAKGVWHSVGLPAGGESTQYAFALGEAPGESGENSGWVCYDNDISVEIVP